MNIYRGCTHGCIYCDSRSTCYQIDHAFEDIEVKEDAPKQLEEELRKKRKKAMIGTGSLIDPVPIIVFFLFFLNSSSNCFGASSFTSISSKA